MRRSYHSSRWGCRKMLCRPSSNEDSRKCVSSTSRESASRFWWGTWNTLFFASIRRHTRLHGDWSSDVCSSDLSYILAPKGTAETAKMYEAKKGYSNWYFNVLERDKLLAEVRKHGDFAAVAGKWVIDGKFEM